MALALFCCAWGFIAPAAVLTFIGQATRACVYLQLGID